MTAATITLTDFLLARIADDEAVARAANEASSGSGPWWVDGPAKVSRKFWIYATGEKFQDEATATHIAHHDPTRVIAECASKTIIVKHHGMVAGGKPWCEADGRPWPCDTMRALASVYADHHHFDSSWAL